MGAVKDIFDILAEHTPLRVWLSRFDEQEERKRLLGKFHPDFAKHPEHVSQLLDYYRWNEEAVSWKAGDGDVYGNSHREFALIWSNPAIYRIYEASLVHYIKAGGSVHRAMIVSDEFFDHHHQLLLIHTCMRQTLLGFEPVVAFPNDLAHARNMLGVDCDMIGIVNNRIGYFIRINPLPCMVRTTDKKFIGRGWEAHREMCREAVPFEKWLSGCSFAHRRNEVIAAVEDECRLISEYADNFK